MNEREDRRRYTRCSFCGKGQDQVRKLVAGPGVFICDQCIDLCQEVLEDDNRSAGTKKQKTGFIPNPKTICAALDAASSTSTRSTRSRASRTTLRSHATSAGKACSRRC